MSKDKFNPQSYLNTADTSDEDDKAIKSFCVRLTKYELNIIEDLAKKERRSLNNAIKASIVGYHESKQK